MLKEYLQKKYFQGKIGGECIAWLHNIVDFPYMGVDPKGNDVNLKFKFVQSRGECFTKENIEGPGLGARVGDLIFTTDGAYKNWLGQWKGAGHGAIITSIDSYGYEVCESNWNLDKKITYGRVIPKDSDKIIGLSRFPLKIDLGQVIFRYGVLINNQKWSSVGFLDSISNDVLKWTNGLLKIDFFPVYTNLNNWWYEDSPFPITGGEVKVINRNWMREFAKPLAGDVDAYALVVRPDQWQGTSFDKNGVEIGDLAYTLAVDKQIQIVSGENTNSPFYSMTLIRHALIHELGHLLAFINGKSDNVDLIDNQNRQLEKVFSDLDFNRIKLNL